MSAPASISPEAFRVIRDRALLIGVGGVYLCEPPFLAKYGREVEYAVSHLERDIRNLKKRFPGKSSRQVDTDAILGEMRGLAGRMKEADPTLRKDCTSKIGSALEAQLERLSSAAKEVQRQLEGGPEHYSGTEAVTGTVMRAGHAVVTGLGLLGKVAGILVVALVLASGYLFLTMEGEGGLEKEIADHRRRIQLIQTELSRLEEEQIAPLDRSIQVLEREGADRSDKVRKLKMAVELGDLEQKAATLRGEIRQHRIAVQEAEASLKSLKGKGFFERLLRQ